MESRRQERFWSQLLAMVAKGNLVPVVGTDLLRFSDGTYLYDQLAKRYADYIGQDVSGSDSVSLSSVVRSHPDYRENPHDIYQDVGDEYREWNPPIPEALLDLAKIEDINIFVSTTFDDLLEKAINQVRFNGNNRVRVIPYSPKNVPSDREVSDAIDSGRPVVFQLFGNYANPLEFALTEGDRLEYMHALQSAEQCPKRILSELHERPLFLLGNNFPDWLSRTFLRMTRRTPLDSREVPKQYFADTEVDTDPILKFFLQRFTTNTELVEDLDPVEFTSTFAEKWVEKSSSGTSSNYSAQTSNSASKPMPRGAVFISYSASRSDGSDSADLRCAMNLKNALEDADIPVWLDQDQLQGGDQYERKIKQYINTCSAFIPLISETTNAREAAFFRREWRWAIDRLPEFTGGNRKFLFPMSIGDIDPYTAKIPEEFSNYQFFDLPAAGPEGQAIAEIKAAYMEANGLTETGMV